MSKTLLLTGATDGIGLQTAKKLVADGHHVLLHGRNPAKLEAIAEELSANGNVETYVADLSSIADVQALAKAITEKHDSLDVLINNAGVFKTPQPRTKDDLDVRFVVNTIAPYLLTQQLRPLLGNKGRVVNLSSAAQAPVNLQALAGKGSLADMDAYAQSKLAITMWTRELADSLPNGPMIVAVNPGSLLATKMVKEGFGTAGHDINIGVDILTRAALSDEFADASGKYFDNDVRAFGPPHPDALDSQKNKAVVDSIESVLQQLT